MIAKMTSSYLIMSRRLIESVNQKKQVLIQFFIYKTRIYKCSLSTRINSWFFRILLCQGLEWSSRQINSNLWNPACL